MDIYEVEIADDESRTEYYYLDINALNEVDPEEDDETTFVLFLLGEISDREVRKLCSMPDDPNN